MVMPEEWLLSDPVQSVFFDCDGTLSLIEGINQLAEINGVGEAVTAITERCMAQTGMSIKDYQDRLDLVKPKMTQMDVIANHYIKQVTPGAKTIIHTLKELGKEVYIISAGIKAAVLPFAAYLGIPEQNVLAVEVYFNEMGEYNGFNRASLLVQPDGKSRQIHVVNNNVEECVLIGDGVSDLEAKFAVARFIGFGGMNERIRVKEGADFYIITNSLLPVLPLCLTRNELMTRNEGFLFNQAHVYRPA